SPFHTSWGSSCATSCGRNCTSTYAAFARTSGARRVAAGKISGCRARSLRSNWQIQAPATAGPGVWVLAISAPRLPLVRQQGVKRMALNLNQFTVKAQEAVLRSQELAQARGNPEILPLHVLASLLAETEGVVRPVLQKVGADIGDLNRRVEEALARLPSASGTQTGISQKTQEVFRIAHQESDAMKDAYVSTEIGRASCRERDA